MRATNSSRRLRFSSVSRSMAWSDFFSDATSASSRGAKCASDPKIPRPRLSAWPVVRPTSDRAGNQPMPQPGAALRLRLAACAQADVALVRLDHCGSVAQRFSSPNPRSPGIGLPVPPGCPHPDHRLKGTYGVDHHQGVSPWFVRRRVSPKTSLHYLRKCSRPFSLLLSFGCQRFCLPAPNPKARVSGFGVQSPGAPSFALLRRVGWANVRATGLTPSLKYPGILQREAT